MCARRVVVRVSTVGRGDWRRARGQTPDVEVCFFFFNLIFFITRPEYPNKIDIVDEYAHSTSYFYNAPFIAFRGVVTSANRSKSTGPTEQ